MKLSNLQKIASSLGQRYYTLELVFNLYRELKGESIVQVGCESKDSQYANFDLFEIFAELNEETNGSTYNIYHDEEDKERAEHIERIKYKKYNPHTINIKNISEYDSQSIKYIDLFILNNICYPINELCESIKEFNYLEARNLLNALDDSELIKLYGHLITPCREKMLFDYKTFKSRLSRSAIVVLEGNDYPGGSQTLLVKKQLESDGFICLLDLKQSIWIRR